MVVVDVDALDSARARGIRGKDGVETDLDREPCEPFVCVVVEDKAVDIDEVLAFDSARDLGSSSGVFAIGVGKVSSGEGDVMKGRVKKEDATLADESALLRGRRLKPNGGVAILEDARDDDEALAERVRLIGVRRPTLGLGDFVGNDIEEERRLDRDGVFTK